MQSKVPLYPYNAKTARERGELDKWRESFRENCACAGGIDILIRENFDGMHLKKGTVEKIVELYGYKRVEHVLANTGIGQTVITSHPTKGIIAVLPPRAIPLFWTASFQTTEGSSWNIASTRKSKN